MTATLTDTASIKRQHLLQALLQVTPAAGRGATLPVLTGVRITIADGHAAITATDIELAVTTHVPAEGRLDVVVPARLLQKLAQHTVGNITLKPGDDELTLQWGTTTAKLRVLPIGDWPRLAVPDGEVVKLFAGDIDRIRHVANYASADDARPILTGIRLGAEEVAATDTYRLAIASWTAPITVEHLDGDVLLPARAIRFLPTLLASEHATLTVGEHELMIEAGEVQIRVDRITGEFPPYSRLIPTAALTRWTFNRAQLVTAVRTAAALCADSTPVRLSCDDDGHATVQAFTQDVGQVATTLNVDGDGARLPVTVAFNARYLLDVITTCHGEQVTLELVDALKPAVVREEPYTLLLMPVRTS